MHMPRIAPMRARRTLSVTDFRKNPSRHMADAMGDTLAVLSRNTVESVSLTHLTLPTSHST